MVAMGPQDTYVVKMDHLVTRTRVRGELAASRCVRDDRTKVHQKGRTWL